MFMRGKIWSRWLTNLIIKMYRSNSQFRGLVWKVRNEITGEIVNPTPNEKQPISIESNGLELPNEMAPGVFLKMKKKSDYESVLINARNVVVLLPVFNRIDLVANCIESILTSDSNSKLVIVDDCSTDDAIQDYIKELVGRTSNRVTAICTEFNLGFTGAVNVGLSHISMKFPGHDVLVINSDCILPKDAISRMQQGFRDYSVASVTPLTNSGTIASIPVVDGDIGASAEFCKEADKVASRAKKYQLSENWPEIPTAVGFCMLVSARALSVVGFLDEINFERGYGEEVDWSQRARKLGFKHLLCPIVFVYHEHGASYGVKKSWLASANQKVLITKYPNYVNEVKEFISEDPLNHYRWNLFLRAFSEHKDSEILIVLDHQLGGGAPLTLNRELLSNHKAIAIIIYKVDSKNVSYEIRYATLKKRLTMKHKDFVSFLQEINVNKLIINTTTFITNELLMLKEFIMKISDVAPTTEIRIHDYAFVCPSINLIDRFGSFCDVPEVKVCNSCLKKNSFNSYNWEGSIVEWREFWLKILNASTSIVTYSTESKMRFLRAFPELRENTFVLSSHSVSDMSLIIKRHKKKVDTNSLLIAVPGDLPHHKGARIIIDLAQAMKIDSGDHLIHIFGSTNVEFPQGLPVWGRGPYDNQRDLCRKIAELAPDLILIPAIWPETFNLVSEELRHSEIPIVMFKIGAPWERHGSKSNFIFIEISTGKELLNNIKREIDYFYESSR